ncbi:MAG: MBL fold metallo-hydrolase [Dehalococcoidales bacterium]|nr:MBL fold metallo-hydrolase [Dehalococcoidales bacterium]
MQQITKNVYVETGFAGCNTSFVVTSEGVVVIDTPMIPDDAKKWQREAASHGPLRYVINTEPHTDHAAGNYWFGCTVAAHEGTRQEMTGASVEDLKGQLKMMAPNSPPVDPGFRYHLPDITFSQQMTIYLGQHTIHLINMPGHTASETAVFIPEEKVAFAGDNLNLNIPIFIKSLPYDWLESLKRLGELGAETFVPGHGDVSDRKCLAFMSGAVQYFITSVKAAVDKGLTLDETLAQVTMAEKYPVGKDPMFSGMIRMSVTDLYRSLKQ